jgi:hypothetical protein
MQADSKFLEGVEYLIQSLRHLQVPYDQWVEVIAGLTKVSPDANALPRPEVEFEGESAVREAFDLSQLEQALQGLLTSGDAVAVTAGELEASSLQTLLLLSLRRYLGRRKTPRALRIIHAAHRRAILTHVKGPVRRDVQRTVEELLSKAR